MKIIAAGTLTEGMQYHGPFGDLDDTDAYEESYCDYTASTVVTLIEPEGEEFTSPQQATINRLRAALSDVHACAIDGEVPTASRISTIETLSSLALGKLTVPGCDIVIVGNPADGFKHYGPFQSTALAQQWADRVHGDDTWWVVTIIKQEG
jgi:hypothetical protein